MVRGACRFSAYTLTLNPGGTSSCAPFGLATTRAELLAEGVAKGSGSFRSCAAAAVQSTARKAKIVNGRRFIVASHCRGGLWCVYKRPFFAESTKYEGS